MLQRVVKLNATKLLPIIQSKCTYSIVSYRWRFVLLNKAHLTYNNRYFSLSKQSNAIPVVLWPLVRVLSKGMAIIVGKASRLWFRKTKPHLNVAAHVRRNKFRYFILTSAGVVGGNWFYKSHLQVAPVTNRKRFILFLPFQMDEIEELSKSALQTKYVSKVVTTETVDVRRIINVLNTLKKANSDIEAVSNTNWKLTLINEDETINAMAFPSGHIIVYTGLLKNVKNDHELAGILGHEMSHAILQHSAETLSRSRYIDVLSICLVLVIWTIAETDKVATYLHQISEYLLKLILELPFSRELEKEADAVGMYLAAKACFDVRCIPQFWERRKDNDGADDKNEIDSTHPSYSNRVSELEKLLPKALEVREDCKCYKLPGILKKRSLNQ